MQVADVAIASHDEVYELEDPDGFVALHRARGEHAFGGVRIQHYENRGEALRDVLRLSEAMTRKCAINGIPGGGAKAVILADTIRDRALALTALGQFVESLAGRFVTGPDLGLGAEDLRILQQHTRWVTREDLSPAAALGVLQAMRGALEAATGSDSLTGRRVAIQGCGAVGLKLARLCREVGALLIVADTDPARSAAAVAELGARAVPAEDLIASDCDLLAPAALGDVITSENAGSLRCRIVCGAANNVLDREATADLLAARAIVYVPDFLASSGATVAGAWAQIKGPGDYRDRVLAIRDRTRVIVARALEADCSPLAVALDLIRDRL